MERLTSQKQIIIDYLKSVKTHPSAQEVYTEARKKLPRISQGTVYRVLKSFQEKGNVQAISYNGVDYFDGDISPHAHFICEKCKRVFDVFDVCGKCSILKNKRLKVGKIKSYKIYFYGVCKNCKKHN